MDFAHTPELETNHIQASWSSPEALDGQRQGGSGNRGSTLTVVERNKVCLDRRRWGDFRDRPLAYL